MWHSDHSTYDQRYALQRVFTKRLGRIVLWKKFETLQAIRSPITGLQNVLRARLIQLRAKEKAMFLIEINRQMDIDRAVMEAIERMKA